MVALEYIYYQKDEEYYRIKAKDEEGSHKLGTDKYLKKLPELSAFKNPPSKMKQ